MTILDVTGPFQCRTVVRGDRVRSLKKRPHRD